MGRSYSHADLVYGVKKKCAMFSITCSFRAEKPQTIEQDIIAVAAAAAAVAAAAADDDDDPNPSSSAPPPATAAAVLLLLLLLLLSLLLFMIMEVSWFSEKRLLGDTKKIEFQIMNFCEISNLCIE